MLGSSITPAVVQLAQPGLTFAETARLCVAASKELSPTSLGIRIGVSANITADVLGTFIEKHLLLNGRAPSVTVGEYDSHYGNVGRFVKEKINCLVLLNFFDNLTPQFEALILTSSDADLEEHRKRFEDTLHITLRAAQKIRRVIITDFHLIARPSASLSEQRVAQCVAAFNESLHTIAALYGNVCVLSAHRALTAVGWERALNMRNYYRYKTPYTPAFCDELARHIARIATSGDQFLKALVLDCDNTLWGGVIGEDLLDGIQLSPESYPGVVYHLAQRAFADLQSRGILLCLCSKNNPTDVEEVFQQHTGMVLRDEMIVTRRVNWEPKAANIAALAAELNIGLDAMAFLDDSPFECEAVRAALPSVTVYQVPKDIHRYGEILDLIRHDFLAGVERQEDAEKTEQYRRRALAINEQAQHQTQEAYLASLDLHVRVHRNEVARAPRIAELTQKSNQFNLTTRRYSEPEIRDLMSQESVDVFSVHVSDKFGDSGLTGVMIVRHVEAESFVEAFLMSCRVLGRGIEQAVWHPILSSCVARGSRMVLAEYRRSAKNSQVADYYDRIGFRRRECDESRHEYALDVDKTAIEATPHITVEYVN